MYQKRNNELEVISLYTSGYKKRFYLREISKSSALPLKTTQSILARLEKERILESKIEGKNKYFSLNLENIKTKSFLLQSEIYKTDLFLEKYPQFKTFLKSIDTNYPIIVFGSFARPKADKNSDADILVISQKKQALPQHILSYKTHQITLSESSFAKSLKEKEPLIREIEESHIILNNHSFFVNTLWKYYGE